MEKMVENCIGDYGRIYSKQFGNSWCKWKSLLEWISCIPIMIWWPYIWPIYKQIGWSTYYCFLEIFTCVGNKCSHKFLEWIYYHYCRNPTLAKCRGESQHSQSWGLGVLRDSRMFRVRQQGPKHLALRCSWCHWKGLEA
jgi:hypothetical protein